MRIHKLAAISAACALVAAAPADATGVIAGATFPEQIVQEVTLVEQYATQAQQLQEQIQQVYNQVVNMQTIPVQLWPNISGELQNLVALVGNAKGLAYASANTVSEVQAQFGQPSSVLGNYNASLQTWTSNLDGQIAGVLQQFGLNASNFQGTQSALAAIQAQSQAAGGRKAVLQAGNQIAGLMVNQLQDLQSDIQAGNQAMLNYVAMQAHTRVDQSNSVTPILAAPTDPGAF
ncbi:P-type conjugative transfer protein TrbJ [Thiomonas intermedia]|uniref:P-type conjugative transfer protein TrbJ n=1 Tax=Thiomonas intermedia TaxID=926 RepID=UPI0009A4BB8A|nr:P-type conjugative transfer protein TrbJ [Thiomonas intermedia]